MYADTSFLSSQLHASYVHQERGEQRKMWKNKFYAKKELEKGKDILLLPR